MINKIKVLSLFDGISCGMISLERAGIKVDRYCAFEIDKNAIKISQNNYPNIEQLGDIFGADFTQFEGFDLLIGGSPCTYWSISNKNREIDVNGTGFQLFMQYKRALDESKCKYFLYENNKGIARNIQDRISSELGVCPIEINSSLLSAQQRKRLYWTNIPNITIPEDKGISVEDILDDKAEEKDLTNIAKFNGKNPQEYSCIPVRIGTVANGAQGAVIYSIKGKSITVNAGGGGRGGTTGLYLIDNVVRRLSVLEAERLQTLPENYTMGVPKTHRYKGIGNGWTINVISHIFSFIPSSEMGSELV